MPNQIIFILILCVHLYTLFLETDVTGRILVLSNGVVDGNVFSDYFFWKETYKTVAEIFWTVCSLFLCCLFVKICVAFNYTLF